MDAAEVLKEIKETTTLDKKSLYNTAIFYYMAGRYPDMTIKDCAELVDQILMECALVGF